MSEIRSNAERLRAAYENWERTLGVDTEPFFALMDDTIEMGSVLDPPELHEMAANHSGPGRVRDYFAALKRDWQMIEFPCERIVEQGDTVVWIGHCSFRNRFTDSVVRTPKVDIWTFRGDRAVRFFELYDTLGFARASGMLEAFATR